MWTHPPCLPADERGAPRVAEYLLFVHRRGSKVRRCTVIFLIVGDPLVFVAHKSTTMEQFEGQLFRTVFIGEWFPPVLQESGKAPHQSRSSFSGLS